MAGLTVSVDDVVYLPDMETPEDRPFAFAYFLTIHNQGNQLVEIKGRKWVVRGANGQAIVVEGDGVVGKFPRIQPGENFSYNSYHVIASESVAEGAFLGVCGDGTAVLTRIPAFRMVPPAS
jgi:ApaG protein